MLTRRNRPRAARWLIAALLFAQVAVAANACLAAASARVDAVASASHEGCDMQPANLNLCLYHCADQFTESTPPLIALPPVPSALLLPIAPDALANASDAWAPASRATGPPLLIRNCCLRI